MIILLGLKQWKEEILSNFVTQFTNKIRDVQEAHLLHVVQVFMMGLKPSRFFFIGGKAINNGT